MCSRAAASRSRYSRNQSAELLFAGRDRPESLDPDPPELLPALTMVAGRLVRHASLEIEERLSARHALQHPDLGRRRDLGTVPIAGILVANVCRRLRQRLDGRDCFALRVTHCADERTVRASARNRQSSQIFGAFAGSDRPISQPRGYRLSHRAGQDQCKADPAESIILAFLLLLNFRFVDVSQQKVPRAGSYTVRHAKEEKNEHAD
jgi:hypothetical protein